MLTDLAEFVHDHRPPPASYRRRHGACVEWLPAHGGVSVRGGVWAVGDAGRSRPRPRRDGAAEL